LYRWCGKTVRNTLKEFNAILNPNNYKDLEKSLIHDSDMVKGEDLQSNEINSSSDEELNELKERVFNEFVRRLHAQVSPVKRGNQRAFLRFG
jgi:hypothetical protein